MPQQTQLGEGCWVSIDQLDPVLKDLATTEFETLWALKPKDRARVILRKNQSSDVLDVPCHRWQSSYLKVPPRDPDLQTSYMFHGLGEEPSGDLPDPFSPFFDPSLFNQVTINWYEGSDRIASHSDYEKGLDLDVGVSILTLLEPDPSADPSMTCDQEQVSPSKEINQGDLENDRNKTGRRLRSLVVKRKGSKDRFDFPLSHGSRVRLFGPNSQKHFRHRVPACSSGGRRISITSRSYHSGSSAPVTSGDPRSQKVL